MRTKQDAIVACMGFDGAVTEYPFGDFEWAAMRHGRGGKCFAFIFERGGVVNINVKVPTGAVPLLCEILPSAIPAYHMNKQHWLGILLDGKNRDEDIMALIADSYRLTSPLSQTKKEPGGVKH